MNSEREWIITYSCVQHHKKGDKIQCVYHYWNESRGWVDKRHEATEYTEWELRQEQLRIERVLTTDCRTQLDRDEKCDTRIGQERV